MPPYSEELEAEAQRVLGICNACRYCEGICPVFPALAKRREVIVSDMTYLADLCHRCGACYDVCQYAEPHPFNIAVPQLMAELRVNHYADFVRPKWLAVLLRQYLFVFLGLALIFTLVGVLALVQQQGATVLTHVSAQGNFYEIISHEVMVILGCITFGLGALGFMASISAYARAIKFPVKALLDRHSWYYAIQSAATLHVLGEEQGCESLGTSYAKQRRWGHHSMAYGFLACFAATTVATFYHFVLAQPAPYPLFSLPVLLGTAGGIGLTLGPLYLLWLKSKINGLPVGTATTQTAAEAPEERLNVAMLWVLVGVSSTGLLLLILRGTVALTPMLLIHLALVYSFFLLAPFSKLLHGPFRFMALFKHGAEKHGAELGHGIDASRAKPAP